MMQKKAAIPIQPIDFDIAKRAVDEFASERNVPTNAYPRPAPALTEEKGRGAIESEKLRRSPCTKFTLELPDYVLDAIMHKALSAKPRATAKYVILQALLDAGFFIREEDLKPDGRRTAS